MGTIDVSVTMNLFFAHTTRRIASSKFKEKWIQFNVIKEI